MKSTHRNIAVAGLAMALALAPSPPAAGGSHGSAPAVDPANFVNGVDNPFFPLPPGTTFLYVGTENGLPSRDLVQVTRQTKRILGVSCTVVHDQVFEAGVLAEDTLDWYAQDTSGNVWYFGEDSKELDPSGNVISTEGSWEAGVNGAVPGIIMEADPRVGDRYLQEFAEDVAEDLAKVLSLKQSACVAYGCFDSLLLTRESTPLEPGANEYKYYARGVGTILVQTVRTAGAERSELVSVTAQGSGG